MALRDLLRSITAPDAGLPPFDLDAAPESPFDLFGEWLATAIDGGVSQPNAMTLSTASGDADPSARTLLLKDVDDRGFWFASLSRSRKGADIEQNPRAALTLYWREQGRQVRVIGRVAAGSRELSTMDFLARHPVARLQAIAGDQSEPMPDPQTVDALVAAAQRKLDDDAHYVPDTWNAYVVEPDLVEFWATAPGHEHRRLRYRRAPGGWTRERLWP